MDESQEYAYSSDLSKSEEFHASSLKNMCELIENLVSYEKISSKFDFNISFSLIDPGPVQSYLQKKISSWNK